MSIIPKRVLAYLEGAWASAQAAAKTGARSAGAAGAQAAAAGAKKAAVTVGGATMAGLGVLKRNKGKIALGAAAGVGLTFADEIAGGVADAGEGVHEAITNARYDERRGVLRQARQNQMLREIEARKQERAVAMNTMRLQQLDPHLYAEISAGRQLARDSVPIGGRKREDLLRQVALQMSQGRFGGPPPDTGEGAFLGQ